jgi:N-acetylmuramoyl-L-alanine amidase
MSTRPPLVVLDRQHGGTISWASQRGAEYDIDGDGVIEQHEREANLTPHYIAAAEKALQAAGCDVIVMSDGFYDARHQRAKSYLAHVYVACHLNAGGGSRGLVFHDRRSKQGPYLAAEVAVSLANACPELSGGAGSVGCYDDREYTGMDTFSIPWLYRAFNTIKGVYDGSPVGICYEPFFIDAPAQAELASLPGLERVGEALARGIVSYLRQRGLL